MRNGENYIRSKREYVPDHRIQCKHARLLLPVPLADIDTLAPDSILLLPVLQPLICNHDLWWVDWIIQHLQQSLHGKQSHIYHFEDRLHPAIAIACGHYACIDSQLCSRRRDHSSRVQLHMHVTSEWHVSWRQYRSDGSVREMKYDIGMLQLWFDKWC